MTWLRSCAPQRRPEVGSASIGQPVAAASAVIGSTAASARAGSADEHATRVRDIGRRAPRAADARRLPHLDPRACRRPARPVVGVEVLGDAARAARAAGSSGARARGARPRPSPRRGRRASGGRRRLSRPGSWLPTSTNHFASRAVELELVDGLPGAGVAQLGRAVGGQHDQRHARLVGLDDSGEEVGRGGAGRARDGHRTARSPSRSRAPGTRPIARRARTPPRSRPSSASA